MSRLGKGRGGREERNQGKKSGFPLKKKADREHIRREKDDAMVGKCRRPAKKNPLKFTRWEGGHFVFKQREARPSLLLHGSGEGCEKKENLQNLFYTDPGEDPDAA